MLTIKHRFIKIEQQYLSRTTIRLQMPPIPLSIFKYYTRMFTLNRAESWGHQCLQESGVMGKGEPTPFTPALRPGCGAIDREQRHSWARLISPDTGWKWSLQQLAQVSNFQAHNEFHTLFTHCFLSNFFLQYSFFNKYIATNIIPGFHILHPLLDAWHALSSLTLECQRIHKEIFLQLLLLLTGTE